MTAPARHDGALPVTLADVRAAAATIAGAVERTPLAHSRTLSEICGCKVFLKFENLQYTASFKERGALNKLARLAPAQRRAGVIACSAGNHAQGIAYHAQRLGIPAVIVMPEGTPFTKISQTRRFGAEVVVKGADLSEAQDHAGALQRDRGLVFVHPYDDPEIIAGQGTIALEMLEGGEALDALVVPVGGGGLISGIAVAAKALRPAIAVYGVEAALYPAMSQVLRGEDPRAGGVTIAEGIAVKRPGAITRKIVAALVEDIVLVNENALEQAVLLMLEIEKSVTEGAGAAGLAAVVANRALFAGKRVGIVISGGNIDARLLSAILMRGLVRSGRLVRIRVDISDQPGLLGRVANLIGEAGGNIVEVYHQRLFHDVPLKMAELDVVIETRDARHVDEILAALRAAGLPANLLSSVTGEEIR
ncbi:MAG: threonine ammonia-lyase [Alphaproteobacteria bacterium]